MALLHVPRNNYTCFTLNAKIYGAEVGAEALSTSALGHRRVRCLAKTLAPLAMAPRRVSSAPKVMAPMSRFINKNQTIRGLSVNIFFFKKLRNKKIRSRGLEKDAQARRA